MNIVKLPDVFNSKRFVFFRHGTKANPLRLMQRWVYSALAWHTQYGKVSVRKMAKRLRMNDDNVKENLVTLKSHQLATVDDDGLWLAVENPLMFVPEDYTRVLIPDQDRRTKGSKVFTTANSVVFFTLLNLQNQKSSGTNTARRSSRR